MFMRNVICGMNFVYKHCRIFQYWSLEVVAVGHSCSLISSCWRKPCWNGRKLTAGCNTSQIHDLEINVVVMWKFLLITAFPLWWIKHELVINSTCHWHAVTARESVKRHCESSGVETVLSWLQQLLLGTQPPSAEQMGSSGHAGI